MLFRYLVTGSLLCGAAALAGSDWVIDSQKDWQNQVGSQTGLAFKNGLAEPTAAEASFESKIKTFEKKRSVKSVEFTQSPIWQNWNATENVGPSNLRDAPVFLSLGPDNYWIFGRYGNSKTKGGRPAAAEVPSTDQVKVEGFDMPLRVSKFPNQYDAPGGLKKGKGGYHAWQSRDMKTWVHHGAVTEKFSCWVTSAEHADGKTYIYYDYPNDQDPHVYVDEDLTDGEPGKNMGKALDDPSDGSDSGFIRDEQGRFHVIFEDWSPIDASKNAWDSPLAGHAVSDDGVTGYKILKPAVDHRTKPTGKVATYKHPHWLQHPDWDTNIAEYEVHEPAQNAYGDWAAICIGSQYYLFCDFDPAEGHSMSAAWFTSSSINEQFEYCDHIGKGHPDPDIGFAEGQFYLITQQKTDWVSPGPWVEHVEARVGVDEDGDGKVDQWTDWQPVKESYDHKPDLAKHVTRTPAALDASGLPAGLGFQVAFKVTDTTENKSKPSIDRVTIRFAE